MLKQYYYMIGFFLSLVFLPLSFFLLKKTAKVDLDSLNYFKAISSVIIIFSGIVISPYCLPWQLPIILPMFWFMVLYCLIEEYTKISKNIILYAISAFGLILAISSGLDKNTIIISLTLSLAIFAAARVSDRRKAIIDKLCNPLLLPIIILNVKYGNYALFFRNVYLTFIAYNFGKILYAFLNINKVFERNFMLINVFNFSKYYCFSWLLVFLSESNHIISLQH